LSQTHVFVAVLAAHACGDRGTESYVQAALVGMRSRRRGLRQPFDHLAGLHRVSSVRDGNIAPGSARKQVGARAADQEILSPVTVEPVVSRFPVDLVGAL
jgi:hypothetical protein